MYRAREGCRETVRVGKDQGGLKRVREGWRGQKELKRARECCTWPGGIGESQGVGEVQGVGPGSVIEGHGVWKRPGRD